MMHLIQPSKQSFATKRRSLVETALGGWLALAAAVYASLAVAQEAKPRPAPAKLAAGNAAAAMGIAKETGSIATGLFADLALLDEGLNVQATMVRGSTVYERPGWALSHGARQG